MDRSKMIESLKNSRFIWDIIIIGGGASGLGAAVDAASRGYQTLLLEQGDFAQGTSSRSTKLIHGGLRYLKQGHLSLIREALHERAILMKNAPHLVHPQQFLLPTYSYFSSFLYYTGIKLYDFLAGKLNLGISSKLSNEKMLQLIPTLNPNKLKGGISYFDGQFDDARLAINLAQTFIEQGGVAINYIQVQNLIKRGNNVQGVIAVDKESTAEYEIQGKVVINATGAFVDTIRCLDKNDSSSSVVPSQGTHIVLDRSFFPSNCAMIIPKTSDDRVLFLIPWYQRVLIGTTDVLLRHISIEPKPSVEEIEYLLKSIKNYLTKTPSFSDILSTFAGIRPLVKPIKGWKHTASLSRDHRIMVSSSQLVSVIGGKWSTYRRMGEDTIEIAIRIAKLPYYPSQTKQLCIHGYLPSALPQNEYPFYGSDALLLEKLNEENSLFKEKLHPKLSCRHLDVVWAVRHEMARCVEDVLSRRSRSLLLDANASIEIAPKVARIMATELKKSPEWEKKQVFDFQRLAQAYRGQNNPQNSQTTHNKNNAKKC